jgi:hypothetical protein
MRIRSTAPLQRDGFAAADNHSHPNRKGWRTRSEPKIAPLGRSKTDSSWNSPPDRLSWERLLNTLALETSGAIRDRLDPLRARAGIG